MLKHIRSEGVCSENDARLYIARVLDVVGYIHDYGIVHRDLKVLFSFYYD